MVLAFRRSGSGAKKTSSRGDDTSVDWRQRLFDADTPGPRSRREPTGLAALLVPPDFIPERVVTTRTWAEAVFEPIMLIAATICFVVGIIQFGLAFEPAWPAAFVAPLGVFVSIEAFVYSRRLTYSRSQFKEWIVLLAPVVVLERILTLVFDQTSTGPVNLRSWVTNPASFFTLGFLANIAILFFCWIVVFRTTQNLNQLRVQFGEIGNLAELDATPPPAVEDEVDPDVVQAAPRRSVSTLVPRDRFEDNWRAFDHSAPLRQLGQTYVSGGIVLVILASPASPGSAQLFSLEALGQIVGLQRPSLHLVLANVLAYFLCGLALLGECHFVRQRTLWRIDRMSIPTNVSGRWVGSLSALIAVATIVAFILPTSYAMTLGDIVTAVAGVFVQIGILIAAGLFYLAYLISKLIPLGAGGKDAPSPSPPPPIPSMSHPPADTSPFELLRSLLFWVVVLAIVGYSLYAAWRRRPAWLNVGFFGGLARRFRHFLDGLLRAARRAGRQVARVVALVPHLWRPPPVGVPNRFRFVSLSRLGPRELVEYFYVSICERAAQLGHPRPPGATPDEFERVLRDEFPLVEPEISSLTAAFVEARYGPRGTTKDDVSRIRPSWQALKQKLRRLRVSRLPRR